METDEKKRRGKEAAALSGGHLCHVCGYQYPNPHPSAKLRRSHRKNCGKVTAPVPEVEVVVAGEPEQRNAGEGMLLVGEAGGQEGSGAGDAEGFNGGSALRGSAAGVDDSVNDKQTTEHDSPNSAGVQNIASESSEKDMINCINSRKVSLEDPGVEAIAREFSENGLVDGTSNSVDIINEGNTTELHTACNDRGQIEVARNCSGIAPLPVGRPAEREDSFDEYQDASPFLHQSDSEDGAAPCSEISAAINNSNTVSSGSCVTASKNSLATNGSCKDQISGDLNMADLSADSMVGHNLDNGTFRLAEPVVNLKRGDPYECSVNVGSNYTDTVDNKSDKTFDHTELIGDLKTSSLQETHPLVLDPELQSTYSMSEASQGREVVGSDKVEFQTTINSSTTELPTQNYPVEDTSDVHLASLQSDCPVTNVDDMLNSVVEDNCSDLEFTFMERPKPDTGEEIVELTEQNPSVQKSNGFTKEEAKQIDREVPTEDQFSMSQKHDALPMNQTSSANNPFNVEDDAKNDDLFELPSGSCYLEAPHAVEARQQVDSTSLTVDQPTVSIQILTAEAQHCNNSNECILAASSASEYGHTVGPEEMPVSSSSEPVKNTCLTDVPVGMQGHGVHTSAMHLLPSQVAPMQTEDATAKEMTAVHTKDTYAGSVEAKKLTEDTAADVNVVQHTDYVEEKKQSGSTKEESGIQNMRNVEENKQAEDTSVKETNAEFDVEEKRQTHHTSAEKMTAIEGTDDFLEKMCGQAPSVKEMIATQSTAKVQENKQTNALVSQEGNDQKAEIGATGVQMNSGRVHVPLKVLLAEASAENKMKKPSAKERVLSFRRRVSKNDNSGAKSVSPKSGSADRYWNSPAMLPLKDIAKKTKAKKQPWMPFICCHSVQ